MPDGSFKELTLKQYRGRYVILVMYPREKEGGGKGGVKARSRGGGMQPVHLEDVAAGTPR
jgi:hypothetical protein